MRSVVLYSFVFFSFTIMPDNFRTEQQKFTRVKTAYADKEKTVKAMFSSKGVEISSAHIFIRAFKKEKELEVWAKLKSGSEFVLINAYDICSSSGDLGPKRKQGDMQVPEGFYEIDLFNPYSIFYLSIRVNYPNASDKILGEKGKLGGEIFIHGDCVTIGCLPLTDDKIKEVYVMAVEAKTNGQVKIPVHIFPCKMDEKGMKELKVHKEYFEKDSKILSFWTNIQKGYEHFEKGKTLPIIKVSSSGEYVFN